MVRVLLFLAGCPFAAAAQQSTPPAPPDTTAAKAEATAGTRLAGVGEAARGLTGRTATLTADELDARGVTSLAEAMDQLPGVTLSEAASVSVRGFSVSPGVGLPQGVTVYVDGVRANEPDAHEVNFDLLPTEDLDRMVVVYGPSVLLGRNSLGAAVNLVTRRGSDPAEQEVELSSGSFGRYEAKLNAGDRFGDWDYYIGGRYEYTDGWRAATQTRVATLFGKLGMKKGGWDATLSYSGADNRGKEAGTLPESLFAANPQINFTQGDYFAPQAHLVILNAQRFIFGDVQLAINGFGRSINSDQYNVNFVGENSRQLTSARQGGGAVQLSKKVGPAGHEVSLLGGLDGDYLNTGVHIYEVPGSGVDSLTEYVRTNEADVGAFVGASVQLVPRVTATAAARYDWIRLPLEDEIIPSQSGVNYYQRLSPRFELNWYSPSGHTAYVAVSRGFRTPALLEIGCADPNAACPLPFALGSDPPLRPVVATTYEVGWHYGHHTHGLEASANVFRTDVTDDIFFVASSATAGYFQNLPSTSRGGVELSAQWSGRSGFLAYVNFGYTRASFETVAQLATTRDSLGETVDPGDQFPMVPDYRANVGVSLPVRTPPGACCGPAISVGVDGRYVGHQWLHGDEANVTSPLPTYTVFDASVSVTWHDIEMRIMVQNIFDNHYANFGTYAENPTIPGDPVQRWYTPGLPRNFEISLSRDF